MNIEDFIIELKKLGDKFGYDSLIQFSGCYGATTQIFYFDDADKSEEKYSYSPTEIRTHQVVNIPTDLCSG